MTRNWVESLSVKGVTAPSQGTAIDAKAGGVGRHSPGSVPPLKTSGFAGQLPSLARRAMIAAAAFPKFARAEFADFTLKAKANLTLA